MNHRYKSGENIDPIKKYSFTRSIIRYNSKIFKTFNLKSKNSWKTNNNDSIINNKNLDLSSFSFKNLIINKSTTTSNIHKSDEEKEFNKINYENNDSHNNSVINSNNMSQEFTSNKNINNLNVIVNKPIIKEKNDLNINYGKCLFNNNICDKDNDKNNKFFSPKNRSNEILIPHLNFGPIKNNIGKDYTKLNSFRESTRNKIDIAINNTSSIKAINIHYDENKYDEYYDDNEENNNNTYINYKIIYSIVCTDNRIITCEYNYEKDSVEIIIKNLKEIMNLDVNDIILLKSEFSKKLNRFIDKKKLQIFFEKYFFILNKLKIFGKICKKFDKIMNVNNAKILDNNEIKEKIKDFQAKKNIINSINNTSVKK